jgi:cytochrome c
MLARRRRAFGLLQASAIPAMVAFFQQRRGTGMRLKAPLMALIAAVTAVATAHSEGDPKQGEAVFKKNCLVCHAVEAGKNKIGPTLHGIVGKPSATVANFQYSEAMKNAGKTWDAKTLDEYLQNPRDFIPNTKLIFAGLKNEGDRKNLITYLESQK